MTGGKSKPRILFVHPRMSPFIQTDLDILRKNFDVRVVDLGRRKNSLGDKLGAAWEILEGVRRSQACFSWFAEGHSRWMVFFSRLLGRPSLVVVGGYEVAKLPEIEYGSLLSPKKARIVRYIHEKSTKVLPVDESLKVEAMRNLDITGENIEPVHTGHDVSKFFPKGAKERVALTVGYVEKGTVRRKGLDVFVKAAAHLPDVRFVLVGISDNDWTARLKESAPANVEFLPSVPHDQLLSYYQKAKVYCQLSMYEGLPNALCEAMLCECVPVGTKVSGIPTAIGETGFYAPVGDPKGAADAIRLALSSDKGKAARERIATMFSVEKREKELVRIINGLLA
jgi:glycosyltransferase involved in cell wall biosynthesis